MKEKIILITGGATGIGFAIIEELIEDNTVISLDSNPADVANLKKQIPKVECIQTDVTDDLHLRNAISAISIRFGKIDIIINNAEEGGTFDFINTDAAVLRKAYQNEINVNFYAPLLLTKRALPLLLKSTNPIVVMCSSELAHTPIDSLGSYSASKAALHAITGSLRHQLSKMRIKVIEVYYPYPSVGTDMKTSVGNSKMTPAEFAKVFLKDLESEKLTINKGQSKSSNIISRFLSNRGS